MPEDDVENKEQKNTLSLTLALFYQHAQTSGLHWPVIIGQKGDHSVIGQKGDHSVIGQKGDDRTKRRPFSHRTKGRSSVTGQKGDIHRTKGKSQEPVSIHRTREGL